MSVSRQIADRAATLLGSKSRIVCICHRNPDGDAIGSLVGIGLLLRKHFPEKTVSLHCVDAAPLTFHFLPSSRELLDAPDVSSDAEHTAAIFLDCAEPKLTEMQESHPELFDGTIDTLVIDHHPGNPCFGTENVVIPEASSTCEIVLDLADTLGWALDPDIATCLLTGVYTDTGGLLHSNTTAAVYRAVARLQRAGARRQEVVNAVFRTAKVSTLRLWGRVLEKISITEESGAISAVTEGDFRATGADASELTGAIDYLNAVPGMRFSMILSEREGKVKGSIRTLRDDVDVAEMAGRLHGGGHRRAAGFSVPGKLKPEVRWKVVEEAE